MSGTTINAGSRTRSRRPAAGKPVAADAPFAPMSFTKRDQKAKQDRVVLFEVDGVEYTVPAVVPTGDALKHLINTSGLSEARRGAYLVQVLAGIDALNALLDADLSDAEWHTLITTVSEHAFGRLEEPGN